MSETRKYDFALSFAGEQRSFASALTRELRARGGRVFYDADQQEKLSGQDLIQWLSDICSTQSLYSIVLLSKHYAQKAWPTVEDRDAIERLFTDTTTSYILPIKFDKTKIPGFPETIAYLPNQLEAEKIADRLIRKLTNENMKLRPDSIAIIARNIYQTSDRREREDGLAQVIRYIVSLLNLELSNIGYGTMKAICETVPAHVSSVKNPFSIETFDSGDRPLISLVLHTMGKEELGRTEKYDLGICYEADESKWFYSGWAGDESLDWECRELTDSVILKTLDKLLAGLLVLSETFPKTVASILKQAHELQKTLREMNAGPDSAEQLAPGEADNPSE